MNKATKKTAISTVPSVLTFKTMLVEGIEKEVAVKERFIFGPEELVLSDLRKLVNNQFASDTSAVRKNRVEAIWNSKGAMRNAYNQIVSNHLQDQGLTPNYCDLRRNKKGVATSATQRWASVKRHTISDKQATAQRLLDLEKLFTEQRKEIKQLRKESEGKNELIAMYQESVNEEEKAA